ncbi:hypothetical protein Patl1_26668 [Pistacia atlantica]|uniref:Uncharacterized protein n=1 Tax=Pistacia atlantica TaxID=434234 RepID=A0ACC1AYM9_9ROSI|nr:hypothetical protein Patl1_26668 [Pistacia atlantica]
MAILAVIVIVYQFLSATSVVRGVTKLMCAHLLGLMVMENDFILWETVSGICGCGVQSCVGIVADKYKAKALRNLEIQNQWMVNLLCQLQGDELKHLGLSTWGGNWQGTRLDGAFLIAVLLSAYICTL